MQDDMRHRQELIKIKRRSLRHLEKKAAQYGPLEVPLHLLGEIDTLKEEIAKLEQELTGVQLQPKRPVAGKPKPKQVAIIAASIVLVAVLVYALATAAAYPKTTEPSEPPEANTPTPTSTEVGTLVIVAPTATPTSATISPESLSPTPTPLPTTPTTYTPSPTAPPELTPTSTPLERLAGKIAFPIYQGEQKYVYLAELDGMEPTLERLTRDASEPALSPDGSQIAFRSWDDATRGLIVMNVNGTFPCRVSRALEDAFPCWAQGESLVFHSTKEGPTPRLYTVGTWEGAEMVDSVQGMMRGTDPAYGQYPAWVPDGRIVYKHFERAGNFLGLYIMNLDGANPMPITDHSGDTMPSVSPYGDRVAFMSDRTDKWEVYVVNIDGSGLEQLTDSGDYNSGLPTWSPDGRYIAFASDRGNQWAIWVMKSDGSDERKLFDLDGTLTWAERISWAP